MISIKNVSGDAFNRELKTQILHKYFWLFPLTIIFYVLILSQKTTLLQTNYKLSRKFLDKFLLLWNGFNALFNAYLVFSLLPEFLLTSNKGLNLYYFLFTDNYSLGWFTIICDEEELYIGRFSGSALYLFCWSKLVIFFNFTIDI